jgi:hypothetical protein
MVIRDVRTRWNSTYAMIVRAYHLRKVRVSTRYGLFAMLTSVFNLKAINAWVAMSDEYQGASISEREWTELKELSDILSVFNEATLKVSASKTPTISYVLPLFHGLEQHLLQTKRTTTNLHIRHACTAALAKLVKYKEKADRNWKLILGTGMSLTISISFEF